MNLKDLKLEISALNGGDPSVILTGKSEVYPYDQGKRISDEPIAYRYTIALSKNRMALIGVRIDGPDQLPDLSDDEIARRCASLDFIRVEFSGDEAKVYSISGEQKISASARHVSLVDTPIDFGDSKKKLSL